MCIFVESCVYVIEDFKFKHVDLLTFY